MIKISVIIPTYNCGDLVTDAIESVFRQSFKDYEIIVINDGSTDDTRSRLQKYISTKSIIYFSQENTGLPGARNMGIELAKGKYIVCLDADDELGPDALAKWYESAEKNRSGWVISDIWRIEGEQKEIQEARLPGQEQFLDMMRLKCLFQARFYRKDALISVDMYDYQQKYYEDWDIYIRLFEKGVTYSYVPQPLYFYKIRTQSITKQSNISRNLFFTERIFLNHYPSLIKKGHEDLKNIYVEWMWRLASDYFHKGRNWQGTLRCAGQCLKYDPWIVFKYLQKSIAKTKAVISTAARTLENRL